MEALAKANVVRSHRRVLKADLRARKYKTAELLARPPTYIASMKVRDLMLATPKIGRVKANKMLVKCGISPTKTIGGLTERQRMELVGVLIAR